VGAGSVGGAASHVHLATQLVAAARAPGCAWTSSRTTDQGGHHGRVAQVDPDQLAALRRLRAAFGFVLILEVRDLEPGRDPAPDQAPRLSDDDQTPEPESPDRR
jgi:hypothetical protein